MSDHWIDQYEHQARQDDSERIAALEAQVRDLTQANERLREFGRNEMSKRDVAIRSAINMEQERDEALASVAVLVSMLERLEKAHNCECLGAGTCERCESQRLRGNIPEAAKAWLAEREAMRADIIAVKGILNCADDGDLVLILMGQGVEHGAALLTIDALRHLVYHSQRMVFPCTDCDEALAVAAGNPE